MNNITLHLELLTIAGLSTFIFIHQIWRTVRQAFISLVKSQQDRKRKILSTSLLIHLAAGPTEVVRYYVLLFLNPEHPPRPTTLDLGLMIVQSITSLHLAREKGKVGNKSIVRPTYHAQVFFHVVFSTMAYVLDRADLHRAGVMVTRSFIYPRVLIFTGARLGLLQGYGDLYTMALFVTSLLGMADTGYDLGPHMILAVFAGFVVLERWVAREMVKRKGAEERLKEQVGDKLRCDGPPSRTTMKDYAVDLLFYAGFVEEDTLKRGGRAPAETIEVPI